MKKIRRVSILNFFKALILPILIAVFPAFVYYGNNADLLLLSSLGRAILLYSSIALLSFVIVSIVSRGDFYKAANATFVFLIAFNFYGILYSFLANKFFLVRHRFLLPISILGVFFLIFMIIKKIPQMKFWNMAVLIMSLLIVFNFFNIIPSEIEKSKREESPSNLFFENSFDKQYRPDIYFIIFDEFAGVDVAREFWEYDEIDDFIAYAEERGFFVAQKSQGSSLSTTHLMAERLNYQQIPYSEKKPQLFELINNSKVVKYLKSQGYVIVTFDETQYWYNSYTPMPADYVYDYSVSNSENETFLGGFFDEFGLLLADKTMLVSFRDYYQTISSETLEVMKHREFIEYTVNNLGDLDKIPSPKFVHVHLMLPHTPHIFDENGNELPPEAGLDWNYYFGQYKYTTKVIERVIDNILSNATSDNPPVIIIQSDHGARIHSNEGWVPLEKEGYLDEYKTHILNMLYIPEFDYAQLSQDMNPINTFPIIFNYLFDAGIPLIK